jgi:hypothetical protein
MNLRLVSPTARKVMGLRPGGTRRRSVLARRSAPDSREGPKEGGALVKGGFLSANRPSSNTWTVMASTGCASWRPFQ